MVRELGAIPHNMASANWIDRRTACRIRARSVDSWIWNLWIARNHRAPAPCRRARIGRIGRMVGIDRSRAWTCIGRA